MDSKCASDIDTVALKYFWRGMPMHLFALHQLQINYAFKLLALHCDKDLIYVLEKGFRITHFNRQ